MDTQEAYEIAWHELGDEAEASVDACGCGGACGVCAPLTAEAKARAAELIEDAARSPRGAARVVA